jgi:hypothetical protein
MLIRILRAPEGADSAGGGIAAAEAPAPESQAQGQAEAAGKTQPETEVPAGAPSQAESAAPLSDEDILKRASERSRKNPNYKMSDEEFEAWERLEGRPKAPKKDQKSKEKPESEAKKPEAIEKAPVEKSQDVETEQPIEKKLSSILEKIGAKTLDEAPSKLENLLKLKDELNGKQGEYDHTRRQLETTVETLKKNFEKQQLFIEDFIQGKTEALEYAKAKFGDKLRPQAPAAKPDTKEFDNFLDPDLAKWAKAQVDAVERKYEERFEKLSKENEVYRQRHNQELARENVIAEMTSLAEKIPDLKPQGASIRQLMKEYFQGYDNDPVDARLKPIFAVVELMKETRPDGSLRYPDLETAYKVWAFNKLPGKIAEAQREGRKQLAGHSPTVGLSDQQGRNQGNYKQYSDADFELMSQGKMNIPEDWTDKHGTLQMNKIPKRLREIFEAAG